MKKLCSQCGKMVFPKDGNCPVCAIKLGDNEDKENFISGPYGQQRPIVSLYPGDTLMKRFEIKRHIGNGRFSSVYLAKDSLRKKEVALKVVEIGPLSEDTADLQLKREMKVHNRISDHKYVVKVYDMHFAPWGGTGLMLLSMEYASGGTFRKFLLERSEDLETRRTVGLSYLKQACRGVAVVHEAKAVHIDLKPENLLFCGKVLKVSDFGSAKIAQQMTQTSTSTWEMPSLEEGTPVYMSPEHFRAPHPDDVDLRADIYSLGIILFELLHPECRPPFGGSNPRLKELHLTVPAPRLPGSDKNMSDIVAQCLEKDPTKRYQTVLELIGDLEKGFSTERKVPKPLKPTPKLRTESIFEAIKNGDLGEVKAHLDSGAGINSRDPKGRVPLYWAIWHGNPGLVELLITKGASINAKSNDGCSCLHWAIEHGSFDQIKLLIREGAEVNAKNNDGYTPLHFAAKYGHDKLVQILIQEGALIDSKAQNGYTPIFEAVLRGDHDMICFLVNNGAEINTRDAKNGWTPLHFAASNGNQDTIITLAHFNADLDERTSKGETALEIAERKGLTKITKLLKSMKRCPFRPFPPRPRTQDIFDAIHNDHIDVVSHLVFGADSNIKNSKGQTPLHLAILNKHCEMAENLLLYDADPNAKDNEGFSPLHYAAWHDIDASIRVLIEKGAKIDLADNIGQTPLHLAARNGSTISLKLLVENGATVDAKNNDGRTPLHHIAFQGNCDALKILIDKKPNLNIPDLNHHTPIFAAIAKEHYEVIYQLIRYRANVNVMNQCRNTPLDYAYDKGNHSIISLLEKHGARRNYGNRPIQY